MNRVQEINYDQHYDLPSSLATNYGSQFPSFLRQISIKVYDDEEDDTSFSQNSISVVTEETIDYDIDAYASILLLNMTSRNPQGTNVYAPKEDHSSLTPEVREIWSKIPNYMKAIILRGRNGNQNERANDHGKDSHKHARLPSFNP